MIVTAENWFAHLKPLEIPIFRYLTEGALQFSHIQTPNDSHESESVIQYSEIFEFGFIHDLRLWVCLIGKPGKRHT